MNAKELKRASKFLSLVLRHEPQLIGLTLDAFGWASIDDLIRLSANTATPLSAELIAATVAENDKQRFKISDDGKNIRANQGHSVEVDLQLRPIEPPEILFHGTASTAVESIRKAGLLPRSRRHVHLSTDRDTARKVGQRHGTPVVLTVHAIALHREGAEFFRADNGVWLVAHVPPSAISFPEMP